MNNSTNKTDWQNLWDRLGNSFAAMFKNPTALCYFFTVMILGGGAGIWIPIASPNSTLTTEAFSTYVFAVLAPIIADIVLRSESEDKVGDAFRSFILFICGLAYVFSVIPMIRQEGCISWSLCLIAFLLALFVWIVDIINRERFGPYPPKPNDVIGGEQPEASDIVGAGLPNVGIINISGGGLS